MILAVFVLHLLVFVVVKRRGPIHPLGLFPLLYLLWFGIGTLSLVDLPSNQFLGMFGELQVNLVPMVLTGYVAYVAGALAGLRTNRDRGAAVVASQPAWDQPRLLAAIVALTATFFACYAVLVALIGIPVLAPDVGVARLRVDDHHLLVIGLLSAGWTLLPLFTYLLASGAARELGRRWTRGCVAGIAVVLILLASLGSRGFAVEPLLVVFAVQSLARRPIRWRVLVPIGVALFIAVSVAGYLRDRTLDNGQDLLIEAGVPAVALPFIYAYFYIRFTVAALANIAAAIPALGPYHFGALTFGPLATLLPGHRPSADTYFRQLLGYDFEGGGMPATLLGTLHADGGLLAVALGLGAAGFVTARLYRAASRSGGGAFERLLYAWVWHTLVFSVYANLFPYITTIWIPVVYAAFVRYATSGEAETKVVLAPAS